MDSKSVKALLERFDETFVPALSLELDFDSYSEKLSSNAYFVIARYAQEIDNDIVGFIAYYLNDEGHFCYVPLTAVHKKMKRHGIGKQMFRVLVDSLGTSYSCIKLEVLKSNIAAQTFYNRIGFGFAEDHGIRQLLQCPISITN